MSRIEDVFTSKKKALIPYVTLGYPSIEATLKVVPLLAANGCDIIELGIPFSDPLADGVTIQNTSFKALQSGVTVNLCLETAGKLSREVEVPLVFMTYYNPIMNHGLEKFCSDCQTAGVSGLIIPDLPPEEGADLDACARGHSVDVIYLLAPNSTSERIKLVAESSRGFIYLVSLTGVTGARSDIATDLGEFVTRVKQYARQPLSVGFGISTPEQAAQVARTADGVIIGSKILQLIDDDPSLNTVKDFIVGVRQAIDDM